ncbi:MAG: hypothetical protein JSV16_15355 [Candidatus Hydrogenedentota bacterium]|nr:MAG: hypothetical protein JSV16_15355 [Candidatus Hydrogenedentota bacterium]
MATVYVQLPPQAAVPKSSNGAVPVRNEGSNFPVIGWAFDAATAETIYFVFRAVNYGSGNLTIDIDWYADTASSGGVIWDAQIACITPNTDSQDIETKSFATENTVDDEHLGSTGKRLHRATIDLSNVGGIAADDWCCLALIRDADEGNDDMAGDAIVTLVTVSYSDS